MYKKSKYYANWKWQAEMANDIRFDFLGSNDLKGNNSQAWQDIFILSMLGGKSGGRYLEVGGHVPVDNNNTNILQACYGWSGVTLEMDPAHFPLWFKQRPLSTFVIADALKINYDAAIPDWFNGADRIDYLQLDIDPSINTLEVLRRIPLEKHRFSVITFETDAYAGDYRAREESRALLSSHGYELVGRDVCVYFSPISENPIPFEDWWVDPEVVSREKIAILQGLGDGPILPQDILFAR